MKFSKFPITFFTNKFNNHIKLQSRSSIILSKFVNKRVFIYTGKDYKFLDVTRLHVGYKFGEFCETRKSNINKRIK